MSAWSTPAADLIAMNAWHRDLRDLARDLHDIGLDDTPEALLKLDGIVAVAAEWRALIERRAGDQLDAQAREERETAIPPYGGC